MKSLFEVSMDRFKDLEIRYIQLLTDLQNEDDVYMRKGINYTLDILERLLITNYVMHYNSALMIKTRPIIEVKNEGIRIKINEVLKKNFGSNHCVVIGDHIYH